MLLRSFLAIVIAIILIATIIELFANEETKKKCE